MSSELLLTIMCAVCLASFLLEKKIAWIAHVSGVCLTIMIALVLSSMGFIPSQHTLYDFFSGDTIPIALALMVLGLNLKEIFKLRKSLLFIYTIGTVGSVIGSVLAACVAAPLLGENAPKLAAQLAASYTGGGENAVAMQKIFNIDNEIFVGGFAVDNILTSLWMVLTIWSSQTLPKGQNTEMSPQNHPRVQEESATTLVDVLLCILLALISHLLSRFLSNSIGLMHPILYLSMIALVIGQIKLLRDKLRPSYLLGTLLFAPFFFSIGAISDLNVLVKLSRGVVIMPIIVVAVHGMIIFGVGYFSKISSYESSLASQSLIGGPATAVALAQAKQWKNGMSMGLLLGLIGYSVGNYFGVLVYHMSIFFIGLIY